MSRIGKMPIAIPKGITVDLQYPRIKVTGPKGSLEMAIREEMDVTIDNSQIKVVPKGETKLHRSLHGLTRTLLSNMVTGVSSGFSKKLQVVGIGYRVMVEKTQLVLNLGYSNPIRFDVPEGITVEVDKQNNMTISGIDKQKIGQVAADLRSLRKVEPYKGKGIRYQGEYVRRKMGKTKTAKA